MDEKDFFSMDKLVAFGMSTAVAMQMAKSMNQALDGMQIPGAGTPAKHEEQPFFYVVKDGKAEEPFSKADLSQMIHNREIVKETYVWKPGMKDWDLAGNEPEILELVALTPPPVPKR